MTSEIALIAIAFAAIVFALTVFRLGAASRNLNPFRLLNLISSWAGLSVIVWAFLSVRWYLTLLAIVAGYLISYGTIGGSVLSHERRALVVLVPILDVLLIGAAAYLWVWLW